MEEQESEKINYSRLGCLVSGCAFFAAGLVIAPFYFLGKFFYETSQGENIKYFLANFKSKEKKKNYFIEELKQKNENYESTLEALKDKGEIRNLEQSPLTGYSGIPFFYKFDDNDKNEYVTKLQKIGKSRKNLEKKLCKLI